MKTNTKKTKKTKKSRSKRVSQLIMLPLAATSLLALSGCAGMNSNFGCNKVQGLSTCTSMMTVNQMANQNDFANANRVVTEDGKVVISNGSDNGSSASNAPAINQTLQSPTPMPNEPLRYSETTQQIWIAPWVDTHDNYHSQSYIYKVVAPGHWIGAPVHADSGE